MSKKQGSELSFELSIYKDREGRWVAVSRTGEPGRERTVGRATSISEDELQILAAIAEDSQKERDEPVEHHNRS